MNTAGIKPDDIVEAEVRGGAFLAFVEKGKHLHPVLEREVVELRPMPGGRILTRYVNSREIKRHWRLAGRRKGTTNE
jgi:hypothetical protein